MLFRFTGVMLMAAVMAGAGSAVGAELILGPQQVTLRGIFGWEPGSAMALTTPARSVVVTPGVNGDADAGISMPEICAGSSYQVLTKAMESLGIPGTSQDISQGCLDPEAESVKFLFISDTQEHHAEHEKTAGLIARLIDEDPAIRFVINTGDIVHASNHNEWKSYRNIASRYYSHRLPLVPVIGNHEYRDDRALGLWSRVYGTEDNRDGYYLIDLGPVWLIVLDSSVELMPAARRDAQTAWLAATLDQVAADKPVYVAYHHAAYSSGTGTITMPGSPRYIREHWLPLFRKAGVRMVLNGHEHIYERLVVDGIDTIVAGPAGGKLSPPRPWRIRQSAFMLARVRTVTVVEAWRDSRMQVTTYNVADGRVVDSFASGF